MSKAHTAGESLVKLCLAYAIGAIIFNIAPIYIGALMDSLSLSESQAGFICTVDMMAMAVTGFLIGPSLAGISRRKLLLAGTLLLVLGNIFSFVINGYWPLVGIRLVAGIGAGLLFIYANTRMALSDQQIRVYGIATMAATILGATLLLIGPMILTQWGHIGFFGIIAGLALLFGLISVKEPTTALGAVKDNADHHSRLPLSLLISLSFGVMIIVLVQCAYYAFAERAGVAAGLAQTTIGNMLAMGYIGGILTAALAAWLNTRWGRGFPLTLGIGLQACFAILVFTSQNPQIVQYSICAQSLTLFFGLPFLLGLNAEADLSGRFANVGVGLFFFSLAAGPFFGGMILEKFGNQGIVWAVALGTTIGLVALIPVLRAIPKMQTP